MAKKVASSAGILDGPAPERAPGASTRIACLLCENRLDWQSSPDIDKSASGLGPQHSPSASRVKGPADPSRSEAHTSELKPLMRISYAVFCLKKKILYVLTL